MPLACRLHMIKILATDYTHEQKDLPTAIIIFATRCHDSSWKYAYHF